MDMTENMLGLFEYYNTSEETNRRLKKLANKISEHEKNYEPKSCTIDSCEDPPVSSHEISSGAFLLPIANKDKKVIRIIRNFRGNFRHLSFKPEHIDNSTTFPGFCSEHDRELFKSFEEGDLEISMDFVQKQCYRTLAKKCYELKRELSLLHDLLDDESFEDWSAIIPQLIKGQKRNLKIYNKKLKLLYQGICKQRRVMHYSACEIPRKKIAYADMIFEKCAALAGFSVFHFIIIVNVKQSTHCITATFDNFISRKLMEDYLIEPPVGNLRLNKWILQRKENLIVSDEYLGGLSSTELTCLKDDNKILGNICTPNFLG